MITGAQGNVIEWHKTLHRETNHINIMKVKDLLWGRTKMLIDGIKCFEKKYITTKYLVYINVNSSNNSSSGQLHNAIKKNSVHSGSKKKLSICTALELSSSDENIPLTLRQHQCWWTGQQCVVPKHPVWWGKWQAQLKLIVLHLHYQMKKPAHNSSVDTVYITSFCYKVDTQTCWHTRFDCWLQGF